MRNNELLPYDTIVQATSGEPEAVNTVLQYYGRRIRYASRISGQADKEAEDFITETLLKALFKFRFMLDSSPVEVEATNELPYPNMAAFYNNEEQTLYVKRDVGDSVAVAQCVAQELGHAQLSINSDSYSRADMGFQAVCIGYMLCKKYGVDTQNFAINRIPEKLAGKEPKDIRYELSKTRNAMADTINTMNEEETQNAI